MPTNDLHEINRKMASIADSMKGIEKANQELSRSIQDFIQMYKNANFPELTSEEDEKK